MVTANRIRIHTGTIRGMWYTDMGQKVEAHIPEGWYKTARVGDNVKLTDVKGNVYLTSGLNMREAGLKV